MKKFDLNIEKILEDWEVRHAIREVIANAIDEQKLSNSEEIKIFKDSSGNWHIRDFGRGIKYEHFTQKENDEKHNKEGIIGKFGIGLKDALATFERHKVDILIQSKNCDIVLGKSQKQDFDDLITLHAYISPPSNPQLIGTDFILKRANDNDVEEAKQFFLRFSNSTVVETTKYGEIISRVKNSGSIYINGVLVAHEDNFLFSYNITLLTASIRKALNRERSNVGRSAYQPSVKQILLNCKTKEIAQQLVHDFKGFSSGTLHDELKWIDVQEYAVKLLNSFEKVVFVTTEQIISDIDLIDEMKGGGFEVVAIPSNLQEKIHGGMDIEGVKIRDLAEFSLKRNENFDFKFVTYDQLLSSEKINFDNISNLFNLIGGKPSNVKEILISETMQRDNDTFSPTTGLWDGSRIIIKRSQLQNLSTLLGTVLHEIAHAKSGASDVTRDFETELTRILGQLAVLTVNLNKQSSSFSKPMED